MPSYRPFSHIPRRRRFLAGLTALAFTPLTTGCGGGGDDAGGGPTIPSGPTVPPAPGVSGPAWWGFGRDAQHSAVSAIATQDLNRIAWSTPLDLNPQYRGSGALLTHYGSPVVTSNNTVVLPVKTGASGGFRIEARSGVNGGPIWTAATDYVLPAHNWIPSYNLALSTANRLYAPGAGGKLLVKADADSAGGSLESMVFFGAATYAADAGDLRRQRLHQHADHRRPGGQRLLRLRRHRSQPGRARERHRPDRRRRRRQLGLGPRQRRRRRRRQGADQQRAGALARPRHALRRGQCRSGLGAGSGRLPARARQHDAGGPRTGSLLIDPQSDTFARVSDDSTASPTVGPDGDVYFGVLETVVRRAQRPRLAAPLRRDARHQPHARRLRLGRHRLGGGGVARAVVRRQLAVPADGQVQQLPRCRLRRRRSTGSPSSIPAPPRSTRSRACRS